MGRSGRRFESCHPHAAQYGSVTLGPSTYRAVQAGTSTYSEMDITRRYGRLIVGSNPARCTRDEGPVQIRAVGPIMLIVV